MVFCLSAELIHIKTGHIHVKLSIHEKTNFTRSVIIIRTGDILKNRYRLIKELGIGGNGQVFLALDQLLQKRWAIKIYRCKEATRVELNILRRLEHPMIPRIVDYLEETEYTAVVMDYVEGVDLQTFCRGKKKLSAEKTVEIGIALCDVLDYLHHFDPPIYYRDLKPQNVMMTKEGEIKLIDFDCACLADRQNEMPARGTRGFAPPEQKLGKCIPSSDLYSLGVMLEMICENKKAKCLRKILKKCRGKNKEKRYSCASELKEAFRECEVSLADKGRRGKYFLAVFTILPALLMIKTVVGTAKEIACLEAVNAGQYEEALQYFPERESLYEDMLQTLGREGKTKEAITIVETFFRIYPEETRAMDETRKRIARLYLQGNPMDDGFVVDYGEAAVWYHAVSEQNDSEVKQGLAFIQLMTEVTDKTDWRAVIEQLRQIEKSSDTMQKTECAAMKKILAGVWMTNAVYLEEEGAAPLDEAIRLLKEVCSLQNTGETNDDDNELEASMMLAQAKYQKGMLQENNELLEECRNCYRQLVKETLGSKTQRLVLERIAYCSDALNDQKNEIKDYEALLAAFPGYVQYYCDYAFMLLRDYAQVDRAAQLYKEAGKIEGARNNRNYQILGEWIAEVEY